MPSSKGLAHTALLLVTSEARPRNPNPGIVPIHHTFHGKTYPQWAAAWWRWAYSFPADTNPVLDTTGEFADLGQSGAVWFLAGSFGATVTRTVTVPRGKFLFFPIVNWIWINMPSAGDDPWSREQRRFALDVLNAGIDAIEELGCEIDGVPVSNIDAYRLETAPGDAYTVSFPADNLWGVDAGEYSPSVDVGWYLLLRPLSPGDHTIHITASDADIGWALDVTYDLTVE